MSQTLWIVATVIAALGLIVFGMILSRLNKAYKELDPKYQPLQLRFRYAVSDVPAEPIDRRFSWLFLPMLFYVGLAMAVVAHNAAAQVWLRYAMYALAALGCFAGAVETLLLLGRKAAPAPACGLIKWACFAIWTIGMFAGLFIKSWAL